MKKYINLGFISIAVLPILLTTSCGNKQSEPIKDLKYYLSDTNLYPHGSEEIIAYKVEDSKTEVKSWKDIKYLWFQFRSGYMGNIKFSTINDGLWINTGLEMPSLHAINYSGWTIKNQKSRDLLPGLSFFIKDGKLIIK